MAESYPSFVSLCSSVGAEFIDERADVGRLFEFRGLAGPDRKDVDPPEIDQATCSLRSFATRPEDDDFVTLRQKFSGAKVLNIERIQQHTKEVADFSDAASQTGGREIRRTWSAPNHLRIEPGEKAFEIAAPERRVHAADDCEIFRFAHGPSGLQDYRIAGLQDCRKWEVKST